MVETHHDELDGESIHYNDDVWTLTGSLEILQNGELLELEARKSDRVRGNTGVLRFAIRDRPASINPGNPGSFQAVLEPVNGSYDLLVHRTHTTDRYKIRNLQYD